MQIRFTGYCPQPTPEEGGISDAISYILDPLEGFLRGWVYMLGPDGKPILVGPDQMPVRRRVDRVSIAVQPSIALGTVFDCPELNRDFNDGKPIPLVACDHGKDIGPGHFDLCRIDENAMNDKWGDHFAEVTCVGIWLGTQPIIQPPASVGKANL